MSRRKTFLLKLTLPAALAAVGVTAYVLVARSGGNSAPEAATTSTRSRDAFPPCLRAGRPHPRPPELPASFPFPGGTVLTEVRRQPIGRGRPPIVYTQGFAPVSLREGVLFYARALPRSGFKLTGGDAEAFEADTKFIGHGRRGGLKIAAIPTCAGTVALLVGVVPVGTR